MLTFSKCCGRKSMSGKYQWSCWVRNGTEGINAEPERPESILTFVLLDNLYSINKRTSPSNSCHEGNFLFFFSFALFYHEMPFHTINFTFTSCRYLYCSFFPCLSRSCYFYSIFISLLPFHSSSPLQHHFSQQQLLQPFLLWNTLWGETCFEAGTRKGVFFRGTVDS